MGDLMKNKKFLLYGMGKTNKSVKEFFIKNNYKFVEYVDGVDNYNLDDVEIIVKSPGIKFDTPLLLDAKSKNIKVISDLELFYMLYPKAKLIIITGTNGKTSTARMLSVVLSKKYKCYLGGNIGLPLFSLKSSKNFKDELVIVEASSFMLEHTYDLKPYIYVITSFSKHHLDYHHTVDNYLFSKTKLIKNITNDGLIIIPKELKDIINDDKKYFILNSFGTNNVYIKDNKLYYEKNILNSFMKREFVPKHQLLNMCIVSEIAIFLNIPLDRIRKGFEDVTGEKYRLEIIYNDQNTLIINDAKSTNPSSSVAAIEAVKDLNYDIHMILGGHGETDDLISKTNTYVKKYYLYGENADALECDIKYYNSEYSKYEGLEEVIENIKKDHSKKIILYSPASQSFDQYENFEMRGNHFNLLINKYWHN